MSWLRLPHLVADEPEVISTEAGEVIEVIVRCKTRGQPTLPAASCCSSSTLLRNGTKSIRVRDRKLEPAPTWLLIARQRFKCKACGATVYEELPDVDGDRYITRRLREDIVLSAVKRPFEDAATFHAVESTLVRRIFKAHAATALRDYSFFAPRVFGVDENRILGGDRFVCADIESGKLLDMLPRRDGETVARMFERIEDRFNVEVFCQDMWRGYETLAKQFFPSALVVIDRFHVVRMANEAMDNARRSVSASLTADDRKKLKRQHRIFLSRWERMDDERQDKLAKICATFPALQSAYSLKERFFDLYELSSRSAAEKAYLRWREDVPPELRRFFAPVMRIMKNWGVPIFNYYEANYTNGLVENLNGRINEINRRGYGYDFETLRAKALLRYGKLMPQCQHRMFHPAFLPKDEEERERFLMQPMSYGIDASTLARSIARKKV